MVWVRLWPMTLNANVNANTNAIRSVNAKGNTNAYSNADTNANRIDKVNKNPKTIVTENTNCKLQNGIQKKMHGECEILKQMKMLFLETKLWKRRVLTVCHIVCSSWTSFCPVSAKPNARKRWNRGSDPARSFHMDNRARSRTELP